MKTLILFFIWIQLFSCSQAQEKVNFEVKGICFEAPSTDVDSTTFVPVSELGANYVCLMPYAFAADNQPKIQFNISRQWTGEREEGILQGIEAARTNGLKVMIKPHLWIHSQFTGDVKFDTEEQWKIWEESYLKYILFYAEIAEKHHVEIFCIGTELKTFINQRTAFWNMLIEDLRKVYSGKLTYAANWDNYDKIPFWNDLDYIGIDAYFPLSEEKTPTREKLAVSWDRWWGEIQKVAVMHDKKVIFTELGYRSIDYCAKQPWISYEDLGNENQEAQAISLTSFFESASRKEFFEGTFLWKWHCETHLPENRNTKYTFQNKSAEKLVREVF